MTLLLDEERWDTYQNSETRMMLLLNEEHWDAPICADGLERDIHNFFYTNTYASNACMNRFIHAYVILVLHS
jgi:aminopeptidase N